MYKLYLSSPLVLAICGALSLQFPASAQRLRPHAHATPTTAPSTVPAMLPLNIWHPSGKMSWQWQLTTPIDQSVNASVYDIDLFDNNASIVAALHASGRKAICYVDMGTWENWRPDASLFPASVKGNENGWPGELWLDIRQLGVLKPILSARLDQCKAKGFDGVEPDNIDAYQNSTGFPLSYQDQLTFNGWIASAAHSRGLSVGLKNDLDQVPDLVSQFDWALDEQCFQYGECSSLAPFIAAGKAVFEVEYNIPTTTFCSTTTALGLNSMKKRLALDSWRQPCP